MARLTLAALTLLGAVLPMAARAERLSVADVEGLAAPYEALYHVSRACPVAIARRETGGTFDSLARNGQYVGLYQFGPGETSIWALSRDWIDSHLEPSDVSPSEQTRVLMALVSQYPAEAASAWAPLPPEC